MIKNAQPLSIPEISEYLKEETALTKDLKSFIKKYSEISSEKAKKIKQELQKLDIIKLKDEHIVKIIEILPETKEDLNKIFTDVGLDEDESKIILDKIKELK